MPFLLTLLHFSRCVMRMGSLLLFRIVQMPVAGVPEHRRTLYGWGVADNFPDTPPGYF